MYMAEIMATANQALATTAALLSILFHLLFEDLRCDTYVEWFELVIAEGFGFVLGGDYSAFDYACFFKFFEVDFGECSAYAYCVGYFVKVFFFFGEGGDDF